MQSITGLRRAAAMLALLLAGMTPLPARPAEPRQPEPALAEIGVTPTACGAGACAVTLTVRPLDDSRHDGRRLAILLEWPAAAPVSAGPWHCRPAGPGDLLCLAAYEDARRAPVTLALPGGADRPRHLCLRPLELPAAGPIDGDAARIRLLRAIFMETGQRLAAIDGRWSADVRLKTAAAARAMGAPEGDETLAALAIIGAAVTRQPLILPRCVPLDG